MRSIKILSILITLSIQIACVTSAQQVKTERKAFQKSSFVVTSPTKYLHRELENSKSYDPKPRVVLVDEKAGKYEFRWIGFDGKEKIAVYQRQDAIDAVVAATVEKKDEGKLLYKYNLSILPTSRNYFRRFIVQTFSADANPIQLANDTPFYIGEVSNANPLFKSGVWWSFAFTGEKEKRIHGGNTLEFQLTSSSPPGLVSCKAGGGEIETYVPEEMPQELEDAIPNIFEDLAVGYTIGPVKTLSGLSKSERAKYLLANLPKFVEAGWMSEGTAGNYEAILKREDLAGAFEKAKKDIENEFITSEVFHIIEGLNH